MRVNHRAEGCPAVVLAAVLHRDALHAMVAQLGGGAAAFVGDTTYDTRAARNAGLPSVAVSFGFCDAAPGELGADAVIGHFDELVGALGEL